METLLELKRRRASDRKTLDHPIPQAGCQLSHDRTAVVRVAGRPAVAGRTAVGRPVLIALATIAASTLGGRTRSAGTSDATVWLMRRITGASRSARSQPSTNNDDKRSTEKSKSAPAHGQSVPEQRRATHLQIPATSHETDPTAAAASADLNGRWISPFGWYGYLERSEVPIAPFIQAALRPGR